MSDGFNLEEYVLLPSEALKAMRNVANGKVPDEGMETMYASLLRDHPKEFTVQLNALEREYERKVAAALKSKKDQSVAAPSVDVEPEEEAGPKEKKIERELDRLLEDWRNGQRD